MRNHKPVILITLLFACIVSAKASYAQEILVDSAYHSAEKHTISFYNKSIGEQSRLFNGPEYNLYDRSIRGHAYFPEGNDTWQPGSVTYDGVFYDNVPVLYDVYQDIVVALLYNNFSRYILIKERVKDFTLSSHHFVQLLSDSLTKNQLLETGFYDQLYDGKSQVLAKRIKTIQNTTNVATKPERYFILQNRYYLKKGDNYYAVNSRGSFLNVLKDKKKELQQYMKDNNINYKDNPEQAMVKMASYYDHLTK